MSSVTSSDSPSPRCQDPKVMTDTTKNTIYDSVTSCSDYADSNPCIMNKTSQSQIISR